MPAKPPTPGIIERIEHAQTPEEVKQIAGHAITTRRQNAEILDRINKAAVKRNEELAKP